MLDAPVPTVDARDAIARIQLREHACDHVAEPLRATGAPAGEPVPTWLLVAVWLPACLVVVLVALVDWLRVGRDHRQAPRGRERGVGVEVVEDEDEEEDGGHDG